MGGAIMISNSPRKGQNRKVVFKEGNTFRSNYASIEGGAISYSSLGFQNDSLIKFEDNKALNALNDVSSYAYSIKIKYGNNTPRYEMIKGSAF